jgi:hypothetical protein
MHACGTAVLLRWPTALMYCSALNYSTNSSPEQAHCKRSNCALHFKYGNHEKAYHQAVCMPHMIHTCCADWCWPTYKLLFSCPHLADFITDSARRPELGNKAMVVNSSPQNGPVFAFTHHGQLNVLAYGCHFGNSQKMVPPARAAPSLNDV